MHVVGPVAVCATEGPTLTNTFWLQRMKVSADKVLKVKPKYQRMHFPQDAYENAAGAYH